MLIVHGGGRGPVVFNNLLGHVMGITNQIRLEVGIELLWDVYEVLIGCLVILVFPTSGKLPIFVHFRKIICCN